MNVLIALMDSGHEFHQAARHWRADHVHLGWATCPITENAVVRILSQRSYVRTLGTPELAVDLLSALRRGRGHEFWPDEVSLADFDIFRTLAGATAAQLTDIYLLGLAVRHKARFATFDRRIRSDLVVGGSAALEIVPTSG